MKKTVTKIICAALASAVALGTSVTAGCSQYYGGRNLGGDYHTEEAAISNGGFAVQKGNYVYFINGVSDNSLDNSYGVPVKGSIMRISTADLKAHNYSNVDTVVPLIAYDGTANNAGLFIYGDYIYYSTPSTARSADGEVMNYYLDLKSSRLDGTQTKRNAYVQFPSSTYDFRFVEEDGVVYVIYVAENEKFFEESTGVKNIHSVNTQTGKDTILAYNVDSYIFDDKEKGNPNIYYTMKVTDFNVHSTDDDYNQLYTVSASATEPNEYDISGLYGWDEETDRYINCGKLVFDGVGRFDEKTPFNAEGENLLSYTYTLKKYVEGTLFYTRHSSQNSNQELLFSLKDSKIGAGWNAISSNPEETERIQTDGSNADKYEYVFNASGDLESVLYNENSSLTVNTVDKDGKLLNELSNEDGYFSIVNESVTILFVEGDYVYYSASGGVNGLTFNRINFTGKDWHDYERYPADGTVTEYSPVKILDIESVSDWYYPEFLCGQLLFASDTDSMTTYNYIMACDINGENGIMTNVELKALTDKYNGIIGTDSVASGYADANEYPSDKYANLSNAVRYLFYTGDKSYVEQLAEACNAKLEEDDNPVYSDDTLALLDAFLAPTGDNDWKEYLNTRNVNGKEVNENTRDYYYSVLGKMTSADEASLRKDLRSKYLVSWPQEEDVGWFGGLNTVAKVFFIIGMCLCGLLVIGGIAVGVLLFLRATKRKDEELPQYTKKIKVDTTDDKNINVYEDDASSEENK